MKARHRRPQRGFTLIEVMVAVIVLSAGLLGVAKMQALALSSTNVANVRSIAAIEAASLAATMHENRAYWASPGPASNPGGVISIASTGPTATPAITANSNLTATVNCASGTAMPYCTSTKVAAYDLQSWASALNQVMPNYTATITCNGFSPVSCTIQITWTERVLALNNKEATGQANALTSGKSSLQAPTYTLFVEP
jgi:type IV pilus assembly protein PilV